jgi:hypothetical protein
MLLICISQLSIMSEIIEMDTTHSFRTNIPYTEIRRWGLPCIQKYIKSTCTLDYINPQIYGYAHLWMSIFGFGLNTIKTNCNLLRLKIKAEEKMSKRCGRRLLAYLQFTLTDTCLRLILILMPNHNPSTTIWACKRWYQEDKSRELIPFILHFTFKRSYIGTGTYIHSSTCQLTCIYLTLQLCTGDVMFIQWNGIIIQNNNNNNSSSFLSPLK